MSLLQEILKRSGNQCELCSKSEEVEMLTVAPKTGAQLDEVVAVCKACKDQIEGVTDLKPNHWLSLIHI